MSHGPVNEKGELIELRHVAQPGYRTAFYIAFALGVLYLTALFLMG